MRKIDALYIPLLAILIYLLYFTKFSSIFLPPIFLIAGCFVLIKGSDFFVEASVAIAAKLGMSEHSVGITVVAFGTSLPELAISGIASYKGYTDTAWGNVIGSNVTNILLVLGVAMIISAIKPSRFAFKDAMSMLLVSFITLLLALDGSLQIFDGIILIAFYIFFLLALRGRSAEEEMKVKLSSPLIIFAFLAGLAGISAGAEAMIKGAVEMAHYLGITEVAIAASIVALGTSLPELSTSAVAAVKKHHGIAVGNVIGSNIVNLSLVLGLAAVIRRINIALLSPAILFFIVATVLTPLMLRKKAMKKITGTILLILYIFFIISLYWL
ncbi:MAG TPA: sodium:calcium antiporter [Thermoplasmatales archaeon]|nr:sodium:calcium antiporter [Thermoplasmatales archaeon]